LPGINRAVRIIGSITTAAQWDAECGRKLLMDTVTGEPIKPARKGRRIRV
jgi:hypothetical protein